MGVNSNTEIISGSIEAGRRPAHARLGEETPAGKAAALVPAQLPALDEAVEEGEEVEDEQHEAGSSDIVVPHAFSVIALEAFDPAGEKLLTCAGSIEDGLLHWLHALYSLYYMEKILLIIEVKYKICVGCE